LGELNVVSLSDYQGHLIHFGWEALKTNKKSLVILKMKNIQKNVSFDRK
jgi:hypothetical protein